MAAHAEAETPRRRSAVHAAGPLVIFFACFAIWLSLLIAGTVKLFDIPNWGGVFGPGENGAVELTALDPRGLLARAGLAVGDEIAAVERLSDGAIHSFTSLSAIATRPAAGSYAGVEAVRAERNLVWTFFREDARFHMADGRLVDIPGTPTQTLGDFGLYYFLNVVIGILVLAASVGIALFGRHEARTLLVGIAGFSLSLILLNHAIEAPAGLYRPPLLDSLIYVLGNMFGYVYGYALVGIILLTPRFETPIPLAWISLAFGLAVFPLQHWKVLVFPLDTFLFPYLLAIVLGLTMIGVQFVRARDAPIERGSIAWVSISIFGAVLPWAAGFLAPQLLGRASLINPSAGGILLAMTWAGFVLATLRFRLFAIQKVWLVTVLSLTAIVLFVLIDLALLSLFDLETLYAASVAMVVTTWAIIPLKNLSFAYWLHRHDWPHDTILLRLLDEVGSLKDPSEIDGRLLRLMTTIFEADQLEFSEASHSPGPVLEDNGLTLAFPTIVRPGTARLVGRNGGRSLFSPRDRKLAQLLLDLAGIIHAQHEKLEVTRRRDREDLARDLHDHLGAHLLNLFYATKQDPGLHQASGRAMEALRDSILLVENDGTHDLAASWTDLWSDQRDRLEQSGLSCETETDFQHARVVDGRFLVNLKRILQEAVTNILKHGDITGRVTCRAVIDEDGTFVLDLANDAPTAENGADHGGRGLVNMQTRVSELGGELHVSGPGATSFALTVRLPLLD